MKKLGGWKLVLSFGIFFVLLATIYFYLNIFFFPDRCYTETCFINNLKNCKETSFSYSQEGTVWAYSITGVQGQSCKILVKVEEVKLPISPTKILEGREMECFIPRNIIVMPEEKIEFCHGALKEAIQDQIIEKMHLYIVQKIGQIEKELGIPGSVNTTNIPVNNTNINTTPVNSTNKTS